MDPKKLVLNGLLILTNKAIAFYKLEIPLDQLQGTVERQFPITKKKYLFSITLSEPLVRLDEATNRIGIEVTVRLDTPTHFNTQWRGLIYGSLEYDRKKGEFYFLNPTIHTIDGNGGLSRPSTVVYSALEATLNKVFSTLPIYRFQEKNIKHLLTKLLLKSVIIRKDRVSIELGLY